MKSISGPINRPLGYLVLTTGGLLFFFSLWGWNLTPNLHRIRAALIFKRIEASRVFAPDTGRILPKNPAPENLRVLVARSNADKPHPAGSFENSLRLAQLLISRAYPPLAGARTGPERKLNRVRHGKGAYCSDYMEAFVGLCATAGIPVREWGITADELKGPRGHSLVEIYDPRTERWRIVDPFTGGWPSRIDRPQDGIGILDYVHEAKERLVWHVIPGATLKQKLIGNVYDAQRIAVFLVDDQRIFRPQDGNLPTAVRQAIQIAGGKSFHFAFPMIEMNHALLEDLRNLRLSIIGTGIFGSLFLICSVILVFRTLIGGKRHRP